MLFKINETIYINCTHKYTCVEPNYIQLSIVSPCGVGSECFLNKYTGNLNCRCPRGKFGNPNKRCCGINSSFQIL